MRTIWVACALVMACSDGGAARNTALGPPPAGQAGKQAGAGERIAATGRATGASRVVLADEPSIDLLHNRYLWHLHGDGLIVPIAGEGLRKYDLAYRSAWGRLVRMDGRLGRVLGASKAELQVPIAAAGPFAVRVRVYGTTRGQELTILANGKRAAAATLAPGWQVLTLASEGRGLTTGENQLTLAVNRPGRAGGQRSYALWHSIEIVSGEPGDPDRPGESGPQAKAGPGSELEPFPPLSPAGRVAVGGAERDALTGFSRLAMMVEVPADAWLRVDTAGPVGARFIVRAQPAGGANGANGTSGADPTIVPISLFDHRQEHAAATEQWIPLARVAGSLVRLELISTAEAAWIAPRIAVPAAPSTVLEPVQSVILFVVDTLRADRLPLYGNQQVRTRNMSAAAAAGGIVFRHNQASSPSSPPSHTSIQTGTTPRLHGVSGDQAPLRPDMPLISALAGRAGIAGGYVGNNNFAMGRLREPGRWSSFYEPVFNRKGVDCAPLITAMLDFVDGQAGKRFFLSALPLEPHVPYRYHEGITTLYFDGPYNKPIGKQPGSALISSITSGKLKMDDMRWKQINALYNGEVHYVDECFGTLLAGLEERGRRDDTAIVITSDHGEGFYEHQHMGHAYGHYAELANVPLIVIWPTRHALAGTLRTIDTVTSLIDIAPTVLELLGVPADPRMQGRSVVPMAAFAGAWTPRVVPLEYGRSYALRAQRWKYIVGYSGKDELYDVERDPGEQHEIGAKQPLARRYMRDVAGFYLAHRERWQSESWGDFNNHGWGVAAYADGQEP